MWSPLAALEEAAALEAYQVQGAQEGRLRAEQEGLLSQEVQEAPAEQVLQEA